MGFRQVFEAKKVNTLTSSFLKSMKTYGQTSIAVTNSNSSFQLRINPPFSTFCLGYISSQAIYLQRNHLHFAVRKIDSVLHTNRGRGKLTLCVPKTPPTRCLGEFLHTYWVSKLFFDAGVQLWIYPQLLFSPIFPFVIVNGLD
jgi:hypothetical protein